MKTAFVCVVLALAAVVNAQQVIMVERHFESPDDGLDSMMSGALQEFRRASEQMDREMQNMERQIDEQLARPFLRGPPPPPPVQARPEFQVEFQVERLPNHPQFSFPSLFRSLFALGDRIKSQQGSLGPVMMQTVDVDEQNNDEYEIEDETADSVPMETMTEAMPVQEEEQESTDEDEEVATPDVEEVEAVEEPAKETNIEEDDDEDDDEVTVADEMPVAVTSSLTASVEAPAKETNEKKHKLMVFIFSGVGAFIIVTGLVLVAIKKHFTLTDDSFDAAELAMDKEPILPDGVDSEIADHMEGRPYSPPNL